MTPAVRKRIYFGVYLAALFAWSGWRGLGTVVFVAPILLCIPVGFWMAPHIGARPILLRSLGGVFLAAMVGMWLYGPGILGLQGANFPAMIAAVGVALLAPAFWSRTHQAYLVKQEHERAARLAAEDAEHARRMAKDAR